MRKTSKKKLSLFLANTLAFALVLAVGGMVPAKAAGPISVTNQQELTTALSTGKSVSLVLGADIALTSTIDIPEEKTVTLDLNGYVLDGGGITDDQKTSVITNYGNLTIKDSNPNKTVRYFTDPDGDGCFDCYSDIIPTDVSQYLTVNGGVITGGHGFRRSEGSNSTFGGGIYNHMDAKVIIQGGNIVGNCATTSGGGIGSYGFMTFKNGMVSGNLSYNGGGLFNRGDYCGNGEKEGSLTITGGTVSYNTAVYGAGIYHYSATTKKHTISDSIITNNTVKSTSTEKGGGGGIYNNGYLTLTNCTITENIAPFGGGVYAAGNANPRYGADAMANCKLVVKGKTIIQDNTTSANIASNVFLYKNCGTFGVVNPDPDMLIGILYYEQIWSNGTAPDKVTSNDQILAAKLAPCTALTSGDSEDYSRYVTSDSSDCYVKSVEQSGKYHLEFVFSSATVTSETELKKAIDTFSTDKQRGTIVLGSDIALTEPLAISAESEITLDLNGYVLYNNGSSCIISNSGTLHIINNDATQNAVHVFRYKNNAAWEYYADASNDEIAGALPLSGITATTADDTLIKVTGGCITGGKGYPYIDGFNMREVGVGGGIHNLGKLSVSDVNIVGNCASMGGGISNGNGREFGEELTMDGARLIGNYSGIGAGLSNRGTASVTNTEICYNSATECGGIYTDGSLTLGDGTVVTGNITEKEYPSAGVYGIKTYDVYGIKTYDSSLTLSGTVIIKDNFSDGNAANLCLMGGELAVLENLQDGTQIYVSVLNDKDEIVLGAFTDNGNANHVKYFFSDVATYQVKFDTDHLTLALKPPSETYAVTSIEAAHGSVSVSHNRAKANGIVIVTVTPDKGYRLNTLMVKDSNGTEIAVTAEKIGERYYFKMPRSAVSVTPVFVVDDSENNFVDVKVNDDFYDVVLWAKRQNITIGTDATHFSPLNITTRAQMVTFLWRASGSPEPVASTCSFTDVVSGSYYEKAVLWAVEQGITKGTSIHTFAPDMLVTRGQAVTFLARMNDVSDGISGYTHHFTDVFATDYYNNAVAWAAEQQITTGTTSTTFSPYADCTRAQIVTFLYRNFVL